ncbi:MAG: M61 family metallopeptidase [Kouleothrix sp.]|nr:M61 family metallopeptidase [Kouleothrix sp.]
MPAVTYTVAMPEPHAHLYHVAVEIDGVAGPTLDLALPAWTPGSYMIREYARHVQAFAAEDGGRALPWRKVDKATWQIETGGASRVRLTYQVYANELSVRTSHLDGSHGYFNPATVCMYAVGRTDEPLAVRVIAPAGWCVTTGLEPLDGAGDEPAFVAKDYDELVDSPFECGTHRLLEFEVDGLPHRIALWGHGNEDEARLVEDTRTIVVAARDMFGGLPYRDYTFIVHLADSRGGGLEHRNSVSMIVDRWTFQPAAAYERYLGLTAHEFFHVWNVKRIRPAPLGPFDYSRENYTRQLWTMEGVTDYYTSRLLLWAGLITPQRYLERVAEQITALQSQPGRLVQSLEQSSFDAWIKLYRPDENTHNSSISYYLKGALVGLLLDLEIRRRTGGARALDDVVRLLFERYQQDGASFAEQGGYQAAVEQVAESSFADFFGRYVAGTDELDYAGALGCAGLQLSWGYEKAPEDGGAPAWLGVTTRSESGRLKVGQARADGPAYAAGIYAGDELLALDGFRLDEERLKARLAERRPGDGVTLSLFRRDELLHLPVTLAAAPHDTLTIEQVAEPTAEQRQIYEDWLGPWSPEAS